MTHTPSVTFSLKSVVPAYPDEKHEAIDMTPELQAWALGRLPVLDVRVRLASGIELSALGRSNDDQSWRVNGGVEASREADRWRKAYGHLHLLSEGATAAPFWGWIDRHDWVRLVEAVEEATREISAGVRAVVFRVLGEHSAPVLSGDRPLKMDDLHQLSEFLPMPNLAGLRKRVQDQAGISLADFDRWMLSGGAH